MQGCVPRLCGIGPVPLSKALLARTGVKAAIRRCRSNEAFAGAGLSQVNRWPGLDPAIVNPNWRCHRAGQTRSVRTGAHIWLIKALPNWSVRAASGALITMGIGGASGDRAGDRTYLILEHNMHHDRRGLPRRSRTTSHVPPNPPVRLAPMVRPPAGHHRPACEGLQTPSRSFYGQRLTCSGRRAPFGGKASLAHQVSAAFVWCKALQAKGAGLACCGRIAFQAAVVAADSVCACRRWKA